MQLLAGHSNFYGKLQVQQKGKNTSDDFEVVFQHSGQLNQHFNTPILILVSIFNFL